MISPRRGIVFRRLTEIGLGDARCDRGLVMRSSRSGVKITIDESDNWMRKAKARRAADMFPEAIDQTV